MNTAQNQLIKITENASSAKVVVMDNIPEPEYRPRNIAHNKQAKAFRVTCAQRFFERKAEQDANEIMVLKRLVYDNAITKKRFCMEMRRLKNKPCSFMSCIQQGIIDTNGGGKNYQKSNYKKRKGLRTKGLWQLVKNNFNHTNASYATLTFDPKKWDATELDVVLKHFRNFIIRVRKQYDDFKYVAVFARQKNGNWHFHLLHNAKTMSMAELGKLWKYGFVNQQQMAREEDVNNVTSYMDDNMEQDDDCKQGKKGYLCSKNLNHPQVLRSWKPEEADACLDKFNELAQCENKRLMKWHRIITTFLSNTMMHRGLCKRLGARTKQCNRLLPHR